eukprot:gb/GEZN01001037.1/.p1 GENE.gb/GEZN01001037.1/~~gb/GEZN01001037.1/.p1  ORF type:complete len:535 (-),score=92.25 gb/GEZN01001037.1/:370-1974(-)
MTSGPACPTMVMTQAPRRSHCRAFDLNKHVQKAKKKKAPKKSSTPGPSKAKTGTTEKKRAITTGRKEWGDLPVVPPFTAHDKREHVNFVFIGHVDSGKSTVSGQLLLLTDQVSVRDVAKFEQEAKEKNRDSWYLAYIMDTVEEERQKGKTVEVGRADFATQSKRYSLFDAPGHKNYVPDMIAGAALADVGVLVISAREGEFEAGFDRGGQTREHVLLAKTLGVQRLVVMVTKMDTQTDAAGNWRKERFEHIKKKLTPFLRKSGFQPQDTSWIPVSGLKGINLKSNTTTIPCNWYKGPTFLELMDLMPPIHRDSSAPLRVPILARYKDVRGNLCVSGKVEYGRLTKETDIVIMPTWKECKVTEIQIEEGKPVNGAMPGENVILVLKDVQEEEIQAGFVVSCRGYAPKAAITFVAQVQLSTLLPHKPLLTAGYSCVFHAHTAQVQCEVRSLVALLDPKTGKCLAQPSRSNAELRAIKSNQACHIILQLEHAVALESFLDFPQLGRFTLRDEGTTIGVGKILKINEKGNLDFEEVAL